MFVEKNISNFFFLINFFVISAYSQLQVPKLLNVATTEEGGLYVVWDPIEYNASDPILGYKIKIWEVKEKVQRMYKLINGDETPGFVAEFTPTEVFSRDKLPENKPRIFIGDADLKSLEISYIQPDVLTEIRIQAYSQSIDGEYSDPWRLKVFKQYGHNTVGHRHMDKCMLTVTSQVKSKGGTLPHIYNSHL